MKAATVARLVGMAVAGAAVVWICMDHDLGGTRVRYAPVPNIVLCIVAAALAAFLCKRVWSSVPAPFVAGIAGVFGIADQWLGPYGGVLGLAVGLFVILLPMGSRQANRGVTDQQGEAPPTP